jgi:hypothetical protein
MRTEAERIRIEKMWRECQSFYETNYKIRFKSMPKAKDVKFLYESMLQLTESLREHQKEARRYLEGLRAMWGPERKPRV